MMEGCALKHHSQLNSASSGIQPHGLKAGALTTLSLLLFYSSDTEDF